MVITTVDAASVAAFDGEIVGAVISNPATTGELRADLPEVIAAVHDRGGLVTVAADLLAQVLVQSPGEAGADIAVGDSVVVGDRRPPVLAPPSAN